MPLTSGEFAVLKALVSHPREPLSRDKLMNLARGREYSAMERSIDVQISRLRRTWWKKIQRIRVTFRPSGVWATSLYRTALKHEAIALLATKFICPYVIAHRHLAVRQPGDDLW
ncbi:winged helix-turn-helix domain-containing protein [Escherichia coli]